MKPRRPHAASLWFCIQVRDTINVHDLAMFSVRVIRIPSYFMPALPPTRFAGARTFVDATGHAQTDMLTRWRLRASTNVRKCAWALASVCKRTPVSADANWSKGPWPRGNSKLFRDAHGWRAGVLRGCPRARAECDGQARPQTFMLVTGSCGWSRTRRGWPSPIKGGRAQWKTTNYDRRRAKAAKYCRGRSSSTPTQSSTVVHSRRCTTTRWTLAVALRGLLAAPDGRACPPTLGGLPT